MRFFIILFTKIIKFVFLQKFYLNKIKALESELVDLKQDNDTIRVELNRLQNEANTQAGSLSANQLQELLQMVAVEKEYRQSIQAFLFDLNLNKLLCFRI